MAASRSMLESLLARVRKHAAEPRQPVPAQSAPAHATPATSLPAARALAPTLALEEEIEEYDDELIEILDDGDVASDSDPPSAPESSAPIELRVSAPSVEMRRRAVTPSPRPSPVAQSPRGTPAAPAAAHGAAVAALRAEVIARRPLPASAVVHAQASRPEPRNASFVELLEASLKLGS